MVNSLPWQNHSFTEHGTRRWEHRDELTPIPGSLRTHLGDLVLSFANTRDHLVYVAIYLQLNTMKNPVPYSYMPRFMLNCHAWLVTVTQQYHRTLPSPQDILLGGAGKCPRKWITVQSKETGGRTEGRKRRILQETEKRISEEATPKR